jgi:hypothetical protein
MTPETQWIVGCLRALARDDAPPAPAPSIVWDAVRAAADADGLGPVLAFAWRTGSATALPGPLHDHWRRQLAEETARQLILTRELGRVLSAFARAGIAVIPLKGPALGETLYRHPGCRPCRDLDVLVRPERVEQADALLRDLGYRRDADAHSFEFDLAYDHATLYVGMSGVHVDLHWSLLSDPRYTWDEDAARSVWERGVPTVIATTPALALAPEDLLLYLALHLAVHHALAGLLWYYDLFLLLERHASALDWPTMRGRAGRWRVRSALCFVLQELARLFEMPALMPQVRGLSPRGPRAALLAWVLRHRAPAQRRPLEHLVACLLVDRGRDLLGTARHILLPSPAWLEARYDGVGGSRLARYGAHYRRLGQVAGRATQSLGGRLTSGVLASRRRRTP